MRPQSFWSGTIIATTAQARISYHAQSIRFLFTTNQNCQYFVATVRRSQKLWPPETKTLLVRFPLSRPKSFRFVFHVVGETEGSGSS